MRILGLDIGDVRIGTAVSDPSETIAQGLSSITRSEIKKDIETIKLLVEEYEVGKMVIGLPKRLNGEVGIQAQKTLDFVKFLEQEIATPVTMWDERLTTVTATRTLIEGNVRRKKRKKVVDTVAATIILQGYLDSHTGR